MNLNAYETYVMFVALKSHFTQKSYDYFKYRGKVRTTPDKFNARRDKYLFAKLARQYDKNDIRDFFVANLIAGKEWVGDLLEDDAGQIYYAYVKRKQARSHAFSEDLDLLLSSVSLSSLFKSAPGQYPEIISRHITGEVGLDTLIILDVLLDTFAVLDQRIGEDDILWGKIRFMAEKYRPFVEFDYSSVKIKLKQCLESHT